MKISLHISFIAVRSNRTICSVQCLTERGPQTSVSIIGGLVEPDVVSVEQPTIRETEAFGLALPLTILPLAIRSHAEFCCSIFR